MKKSKTLGQVYTPKWIVNEILNDISYSGENILKKYILEPACGDGAFLCEIVQRYIFQAQKQNFSKKEIIQDLETYIYAIEIDNEAFAKCLENLDQIILENFSEKIKINWKIFNENTLFWYQNYLEKFDFVVGNPPYIRIHNLDLEIREFLKQNFQFSTGVLDIYISFFELGFKVLNPKGKLGYITPNSFLHNTSYKNFRSFLKNEKTLKTLADFKTNKIFQGFSTYTAISIFDKENQKKFFDYKELINNEIKKVNRIEFKNLDNKKWVFSDEENEAFINQLFTDKNSAVKDFFDVQYGFATLRDKIFISDIQEKDENLCIFNGEEIEKSLLKKIVKGSRFKGKKDDFLWVLFPYELENNRYIPISEEKLSKLYPKTYQYLLKNREELEKRDMDKGALWYEFGRSQGIQSIHKEKIVLSTLVNGSVDFYKVGKEILMYSGIFITKKNINFDWEIIENILNSEDFYKYIRITGKDFSGGYKSITTKQIKEFRFNSSQSLTLF